MRDEEEGNSNSQDERPTEIKSYNINGNVFLKRISDTLFIRSKKRTNKEKRNKHSSRKTKVTNEGEKLGRKRVKKIMNKPNDMKNLGFIKHTSKAASLGTSNNRLKLVSESKISQQMLNLQASVDNHTIPENQIIVYDSLQNSSEINFSHMKNPSKFSRKKFY